MHRDLILEWRGQRIPRLVAGTAQLGMPYGIANNGGAPSLSNARVVIAAALDCGIRFFDTAQAYGESEAFLGGALRGAGSVEGVQVISKLDPALSPMDFNAVLRSVEQSVERLGRPLWAMLLHRPDWLDVWDQGLGSALREAQARGQVEYLGASVYTADDARRVLEHEAMDVVQAPANAWDQRLLCEGIFQLAASQNKLCFVRSIFLQGLLTLPAAGVPVRLGFARLASERWNELCRRSALSPQALAVRFALSLPAPIVVGMESAEQVRANAKLFESEPLSASEAEEIHLAMAPVLNERIVNPSRWRETA